jgi:hypothetical protein
MVFSGVPVFTRHEPSHSYHWFSVCTARGRIVTNTVRSELAAAIRAVNAAFNRLPREVQDELDLAYDDLDRELDRAAAGDDRARALAAIKSWRDHHLALIRRAVR